MPTSRKSFISVGIVFVFLFSMLHSGTALSATKNTHGRIFNVSAVGGTNSAKVSWKVEYYHYTLIAYSFGVHIYPKDHPYNTPVQTVSCQRSPCSFHIPTPKANGGARPVPLKYYFVVFASIPSGGFASDHSASVTVKFQAAAKATPIPKTSISPTPAPTPAPTSTPTPTASVLTYADFDGNYSGFLNVAFRPALIPAQNIPFTFQIQNGMGQGYGGGWSASGYVTDAQGNASLRISHPLYGSFTLPASFTSSVSTQLKFGSGSGSQSITYPGVGEIAVDYSFTVANK